MIDYMYRQIYDENTLTVPSPKHLQRLKVPFTAEAGMTESNIRYLKARFKDLCRKILMESFRVVILLTKMG